MESLFRCTFWIFIFELDQGGRLWSRSAAGCRRSSTIFQGSRRLITIFFGSVVLLSINRSGFLGLYMIIGLNMVASLIMTNFRGCRAVDLIFRLVDRWRGSFWSGGRSSLRGFFGRSFIERLNAVLILGLFQCWRRNAVLFFVLLLGFTCWKLEIVNKENRAYKITQQGHAWPFTRKTDLYFSWTGRGYCGAYWGHPVGAHSRITRFTPLSPHHFHEIIFSIRIDFSERWAHCKMYFRCCSAVSWMWIFFGKVRKVEEKTRLTSKFSCSFLWAHYDTSGTCVMHYKKSDLKTAAAVLLNGSLSGQHILHISARERCDSLYNMATRAAQKPVF